MFSQSRSINLLFTFLFSQSNSINMFLTVPCSNLLRLQFLVVILLIPTAESIGWTFTCSRTVLMSPLHVPLRAPTPSLLSRYPNA